MNRRRFLKTVSTVALGAGLAPTTAMAGLLVTDPPQGLRDEESYLKDYLFKMRNFNAHHDDDIFLSAADFEILKTALSRLNRLQRTVGHGNFYLLSFDNAITISKNYSQVEPFTAEELAFLEKIFYADSAIYGFTGEKPLKHLTDDIQVDRVIRDPETGNYLYKGNALETYHRIKSTLGDEVVLTSGIRSVIKQFMLFLSKAYESDGNLSMASRSLAPPGYSFHGIGDFDVGQVGYGADNFTERFTETEVFKHLVDLGYLRLRYHQDNTLGVRFEPWHIKVC
ncbi:MAG: M15 family metallopeptidase [Pseudomonadota bacterium]